MASLTNLPNIGPVLAEKLLAIGVSMRKELQTMGSIEAVISIGEENLSTCYNMLFAIEGAILGIRWHAIPKEERAMLKQEFDKEFTK